WGIYSILIMTEQIFRHFSNAEQWQAYRFSFAGSGVHGLPKYSGRSALLQGVFLFDGLRLRLRFSRSSADVAQWARMPDGAHWIRMHDDALEVEADLCRYKDSNYRLQFQALTETTAYLDLHGTDGLLFSGKVHRDLWSALRLHLHSRNSVMDHGR
ncbi:MAG: hypothetical protein KDK37_06340, partial [Leptospiraceae bacterium]|nr:hypothetical protein [Leptospiraceae bacterium]